MISQGSLAGWQSFGRRPETADDADRFASGPDAEGQAGRQRERLAPADRQAAEVALEASAPDATIATENRPSLTSISSETSSAVASKNRSTSSLSSRTSREAWLVRSTRGC